jgi:hypothetical protein
MALDFEYKVLGQFGPVESVRGCRGALGNKWMFCVGLWSFAASALTHGKKIGWHSKGGCSNLQQLWLEHLPNTSLSVEDYLLI